MITVVSAIPPVSTADTVTILSMDTTPNLGTDLFVLANATDAGAPSVETRCYSGLFRWSENNSAFLVVQYHQFANECEIEHTGDPVDTITDQCYLYTNSQGGFPHSYYIDPGVFELGDVGRVGITCGDGVAYQNFTVFNYRPVDSTFGQTFQWLIDNPAAIFGLFIAALIGTLLLVIILIMPIIIFKRLFP